MSAAQHRVLVVVGTRPEAIKLAPVLGALQRRSERLETRLAFTGQHDALVDQVAEVFDLRPDYDLELMSAGQSLYDVVHRALDGLRDTVRSFEPDVVLVQGDTASVFVGALVGFFEKVRVGHVEAGLRSHDKSAPFPEEVLRRLTDVVADDLFAPTPAARDALIAEGVSPDRVHVTGNSVVDALLQTADMNRPVSDSALRALVEDPTRRLALVTAHRRESFGAPLRAALGGVRTLVERVPDLEVLYPVHPNPAVVAAARDALSDHPRVHLTEPLGYSDLVAALQAAVLVLTDSGGIQEEAPTIGTPVLVLRDVTERPEGVEAGVAQLVGTDPERIVRSGLTVLERAKRTSEQVANPYGDGRAGERIADIVVSTLTGARRETEDWTG